MEYLGLNVRKYVKDPDKKKYNTSMKEIKEKLERQSMFINRKTQYCQDASFYQFHPYIQCNPYKNPSKLFCVY